MSKRIPILLVWTAKTEDFENAEVIHISCACASYGRGVLSQRISVFEYFSVDVGNCESGSVDAKLL